MENRTIQEHFELVKGHILTGNKKEALDHLDRLEKIYAKNIDRKLISDSDLGSGDIHYWYDKTKKLNETIGRLIALDDYKTQSITDFLKYHSALDKMTEEWK